MSDREATSFFGKLYAKTFAKMYRRIGTDLPPSELKIEGRFRIFAGLDSIQNTIGPLLQERLHASLGQLRAEIRATMPENVVLDGYKIYAQTDEDGIIAAIFEKISLPTGSKTFVEIGCGNGLENNTHALSLAGWRGGWIDGSPENVSFIKTQLGRDLESLVVRQSFVTRENATSLVTDILRTLKVERLNFLSVDIDGNDYHVLEQILGSTQPHVVCVEYNAKFPYPLDVVMPYDEDHVWQNDDYQGASLAAFVRLLRMHGYTLIACNLSGVNAFFVNNGVAKHFTIYPPEQLFQPARYHLMHARFGHPPSLKYLANRHEETGSS